MNLRQKLLTIFSGLGLLSLVTAGVTMRTLAQWEATNEKLQNHYKRSLQLLHVRSTTFRAFKEVPDAVTGQDIDARQEFEQLLKPVEEDFKLWADLADTDQERQQVQQVRQAFNKLVQDARTVFDLVDARRNKEAYELMEGDLEDEHLKSFQELTEQAVQSDRQNRKAIVAEVQNARETAQIVLTIAAFGIISLILLLTAYLSSDLFAPLRQLKQALDDLTRGDLKQRLEEERDDELGAVNQAFNRMVDFIQEREQLIGLAAVPVNDTQTDGAALQNTPSRIVLHQLVSQLRSRVSYLSNNNDVNSNGAIAVEQKQELIAQLDGLLQAVTRITQFGLPLDLNLARTDIRALVYEIVLRFQEEFVQRGISLELDVAPNVNYAFVDRLKIREALGELVRNAIAAIPQQGGRLGIRSSITEDGTELLIEVADNGQGAGQPLINQAFSPQTPPDQHLGVGLKLTKAIVEQHGGKLTIDSEPSQGTYAQIKLPLRV